jgi:translocation and assembly module TamB
MAALRTFSSWRNFIALAFVALLATGLWAGRSVLQGAEEDKGVLASFISRMLSSPDMIISIGAVDGALSSDSIIRDVSIADRDGVWFKLDRARLVWSRVALLRGRLEVDGLDAGKAEVLRRPVSSAAPAPAETAPFDPKSMIPDLPVLVDIRSFRLAELSLGPDVVGQAARIGLGGHAKLGDSFVGMDVDISAQRLDAPGAISAKLNYDPKTTNLTLAISAKEPAGGIVASALKLDDRPPVELDVKGDGKLDDFSARLTFSAGEKVGAQADARLQKAGTDRQFSLNGSGRISSLVPERFAALFADPMTINSSGRIPAAGGWTFDDLKLATASASIRYAGALGTDQLKGRLQLAMPDIAPLGKIVDKPLAGSADLALDLDARFKTGAFAAKIDGKLANLVTGTPVLDRLIGRSLTLNGPIEYSDAGFGASALDIAGQNVKAKLSSVKAGGGPALQVDASISNLTALDERLTGVANLAMTATGNPKRPNANGTLTVENATAAGRAIRRLQMNITGKDVLNLPDLVLKLDGDVDNRPATGTLAVAKSASGWTIAPSEIAIGRASIKANGSVAPSGLASGRLTIAAPALEDLSAFALRDMQGRLTADIALDAKGGTQSADVTASGSGIRAGDITVGRLDLRGKGTDLLSKPTIDATATIENANAQGTDIPRLRIVARGNQASTAFDLTGEAKGFAIDGKATMTPGERLRVDIASFNARRAGRRIALASPATLTWQNETLSFDRITIAADSGRLTATGRAGKTLDVALDMKSLPLGLLALASPTLNLSGTLDGDARLQGSAAAPTGDWKVRIAKLSDPQLRSSGVPALDVTANGRLEGTSTTLTAQVAAGGAGNLQISGRVPIDGSRRLDLAARGTIDAGAANTMLAANGQTVSGKANVDLKLSGGFDAPQVSGTMTLNGGSFSDPLNGIKLDNLSARLAGSGRDLIIEQLSATTRNGGKISGNGRVAIDAAAGFPGTLHVTGRNAQISATQSVSSIADFDIALGGALGRKPNISGKVNFSSMDVTVPERLPISLRPLPNAKHIDPGPFAREILALEKKAKARSKARSAFDATLDLAVSAPARMFVRGRGIDAEFGGDLRLSGTVQKPVAIGQFDMRRGSISIAGKRIEITRGKLTFTGGLSPEIDFVAETSASDATLQVNVAGAAAEPTFSFSSQPQLPSDEVLSRILFAKPSGGLSAFQAVMLAQTVAQFTGAGGGLGVFDKLRQSLGVDTLDVREDKNGVSAGASRYISDRISVGVRAGAKPEQSTLGVNVDITKRIRGVGEVSADGKTSVGVGVEWEY